MNLLIVDDSAMMRRMVRRTIDLSEVPVGSVYEAGDGREALAVLDRHAVDALFTDINMPNMNGAELLHELARRGGDQPARVVISTDGSERRREEIGALAIDGYLEKPLRPEVMRDVLCELAQRRGC
jgi:two-component system chemotaxis response regulator CheY